MDGTGYQLPTEAEWEFACRAGTTTRFWIGEKDEDVRSVGWFEAVSGGRTHAVGELRRNPFGMFDMNGNVWEWMQDWWGPTYYEQFHEESALDPRGPSPTDFHRVIRGGYLNDPAIFLRSSFRVPYSPKTRGLNLGFRVSLQVDAVRQALKLTGPAMPKPMATTPSAPATDGIDFAAERAAAEWVLANKGTMSIAVSPNWEWRDYGATDGAMPLPSEPFVITALHMTNSQVKTESDLERLTRCRYLEILTIGGGTIESPAMDLLTRLPRLKSLSLTDQKNLRTSALPKLGRISTLDYLGITSEMVDDRLEFVRHLPTLRSLKIWGPQPPDIDLLAEAPQLRTILLTTPDAVDDAKLVAVQSRNDKLRIVVGWKGKYRTVGRDPAHEAAKQLVELGVECLGGVNYWQAPTKLLTKADFENGGVWSFSVQRIPASVQLSADDREKLKLLDSYHFVAEGQRDADELARCLSQNHGIATITMTNCDLTDAGLEHLQQLVSLRNVNVSNTKVTQAGVERFHRAVPFCGIASDFGVIQPQFMTAKVAPPVSPDRALAEPFSPDSRWSAPVNLGPAINTATREATPSLTSDELLVVFTRGEELFEARRASRDEPFAPATKLPGPLPSAKFLTCCLSGDGLQLVYSAIPPGGSAQEVMIATRTSRDEPFGQPVVLPQPINSAGEDRHPVLSPDGLILALTSVRGGQQTGGPLIFTRPTPTAEFNPTPTVDVHLQGGWSVIYSFSSDGRGLLKTTMADDVETITWHTRPADSPDWSEGQPLPAPFDAIQFGAPFLSTDGNTIYFHSRSLPDGQGDLDLWMSRRTLKTP